MSNAPLIHEVQVELSCLEGEGLARSDIILE